MKGLIWRNDREFNIGDVEFHCPGDDLGAKSDASRFVLLKERSALESYGAVLAGQTIRNMLEFGIYQGGSPAFFSLWLGLDKFVGVDTCPPVDALARFCKTHPAGRRIRAYYGVSQADRGRLDPILAREFGTVPLDLIVDDASHDYALSRRAFEIAFPHLKAGGYYVIEDWGWAHWPGSTFYRNETALSLLVMELMMVCASRKDLISEVRVFPSFAFIRKAPDAPPLEHFRLSDVYGKRGLALSGTTRMDLRGLAQLLRERLARRASRTWRKLSGRR